MSNTSAATAALMAQTRRRYEAMRPTIEAMLPEHSCIAIAARLGISHSNLSAKILPALGIDPLPYCAVRIRAKTRRKYERMRPAIEKALRAGMTTEEIGRIVKIHPKHLCLRVLPTLGLKPNGRSVNSDAILTIQSMRNFKAARAKYARLQLRWTELRSSGMPVYMAANEMGLHQFAVANAIRQGHLDDARRVEIDEEDVA